MADSTSMPIEALASLLKPPGGESDEEDELDVRPSPYATPGSIGSAKAPTHRGEGEDKDKKGTAHSTDIWNSEEVSGQQHYEYDDPRPEPEYELVFKQAVTPEDMFLGMGPKNPTTASCEDLIVKIKLPDTQFKDVELIVSDTFLDCRTPKNRLGLHLPHKVNEKQSKARWLHEQNMLEVTLRLNREYDFLNQ